MKKIALLLSFILALGVNPSISAQNKVEYKKVKDSYLIIPVSHSVGQQKMIISSPGQEDYSFMVRLATDASSADYWVFCDLTPYKGKKMTVDYPEKKGLDLIYMSDSVPDAENIYSEALRPQQHFTFKRGWNNDPNGMIYYDGEYHLFGQHNPYEREWQNMHWGHAVSTDMIHWKELPWALRPDALGTMFSGTAVIDWDNIAGFGKPGNPAMVAIYTADAPGHETQCLAYSLDKGRSWTKYEGNPVLDSGEWLKSSQTRDPKVFWYAPGGHWVMVLYEVDGHSFYTSSNLKEWTYQSHVPGFFECPDFYELPVDGDLNNMKWVLTAASGVYLVGDFDGKKFTPETGLLMYTEGAVYAGQTFNNLPDHRRVKIEWMQTEYKDMPFKSSFSTPMEMTLRTTKDGVRLFAEPAVEFDVLQHSAFKGNALSVAEVNEALSRFAGEESLRIKCSMTIPSSPGAVVLTLDGQNIVNYEIGRSLLNGRFYSHPTGDKITLSFDLIVDRGIVEAYFDKGAYSQFIKRVAVPDAKKGFRFAGRAEVDSLEIFTLDSIWK